MTFNDGLSGLVDLSELVNNQDAGIFQELRNPIYFSRVYLNYGAVSWPNGADLAPDAMHAAISQSGIWHVD